jgi:hypothetical protein
MFDSLDEVPDSLAAPGFRDDGYSGGGSPAPFETRDRAGTRR